ncbi:MAG: YciI family protein [Acidobacteriota bacterium]
MTKLDSIAILTVILTFSIFGLAQNKTDTKNANFDAELAKKLGADKMGMKNYVLVILKTGPTALPAGKERDEIFKGHFANIHRLADEGKLAVAGPFDDTNGWRGMFIFNVETIEDAKKLTETDPVIKSGVMIAEFHKLYCSAALMEVNEIHQKVAETNF